MSDVQQKLHSASYVQVQTLETDIESEQTHKKSSRQTEEHDMRLHGIASIEPVPRKLHHKWHPLYIPQKKQPTRDEFRRILMERIHEKNEK